MVARIKASLARRRMRRRNTQPSNRYAMYMALQESNEISNAVYTLQQFESKKNISKPAKERVPVSIIPMK